MMKCERTDGATTTTAEVGTCSGRRDRRTAGPKDRQEANDRLVVTRGLREADQNLGKNNPHTARKAAASGRVNRNAHGAVVVVLVILVVAVIAMPGRVVMAAAMRVADGGGVSRVVLMPRGRESHAEHRNDDRAGNEAVELPY